MATLPILNIIGCGKVGKTLAKCWHDQGIFTVHQILNQSPHSAHSACRFIGAGESVTDLHQMNPCDLLLIGTPDGKILHWAEKLAKSGILQPSSIIFICSGAIPSRDLTPLIQQHIPVAAIHPVKSFADPETSANTFNGTFCACEGDQRALEILKPAFERIGGHCFAINPDQKLLYHGASVIVCNYLTALLEWGLQTYEQAGLQRSLAEKIMEPLIRGTLDNILSEGTHAALTGPIARGDVKLIAQQFQAFNHWRPDYGDLYRQLGLITLELAKAGQHLPTENADRIETILKSAIDHTRDIL